MAMRRLLALAAAATVAADVQAAAATADVVQVVVLCDSRTAAGRADTINIEMNIGVFLYQSPKASREDCIEAMTVLDALGKRLVRVLGAQHPKTFNVQAGAFEARQKLAAMEPPRRATLEDALAAFDL